MTVARPVQGSMIEGQHQMQEVSIYQRLEQAVGAVLCGRSDPCVPCRDAANRIVVHRKEVREMLLLFAREEAGLLPDPTAITAADLKTMVMQEDDDGRI